MVGVSLRSTMDIDATIKNLNLSEDDMLKVIKDIANISLDDNITFEVRSVQTIMNNFEYPGVRIEMDALIDKMINWQILNYWCLKEYNRDGGEKNDKFKNKHRCRKGYNI